MAAGNLPCGRRPTIRPSITWELTNSRSTSYYIFPGKVKVKEEKEASSMAPGSPPTPPHTPQSPPRQNPPGNLSQSSQTPASSPSIQHPLQGVNNLPLSQILVQNPALAQLLQQNPAILAQNPQLAQLLQQNFQVQMGSVLFQGARRDDGEDARVSCLIDFNSNFNGSHPSCGEHLLWQRNSLASRNLFFLWWIMEWDFILECHFHEQWRRS